MPGRNSQCVSSGDSLRPLSRASGIIRPHHSGLRSTWTSSSRFFFSLPALAHEDKLGRRTDFRRGDRAAEQRWVGGHVIVPLENHVADLERRLCRPERRPATVRDEHAFAQLKSVLRSNLLGHVERQNAQPRAVDVALGAQLVVSLAGNRGWESRS